MCQYSHLDIGDRVQLNRTSVATCDECGSPTDFIGSKRYATYTGHVISNRYGVCDRFNYENPTVCLSCGAENDYSLVPCESGLDGFALREKVEVEREGYSTRH